MLKPRLKALAICLALLAFATIGVYDTLCGFPVQFTFLFIATGTAFLSTPWIFLLYRKIFFWSLKTLKIEIVPKSKATLAFACSLMLAVAVVITLFFTLHVKKMINVSTRTAQVEVIETKRIKSKNSDLQDTCYIKFQSEDGTVLDFSFAWQSDRSFHSKIYQGDTGNLTCKLRDGRWGVAFFEKAPEYGGTKIYTSMLDKVSDLPFWRDEMTAIVFCTLSTFLVYPFMWLILFAIAAQKKRIIVKQKRWATVVTKDEYDSGHGEDHQTILYAVFECDEGSPRQIKIEFASKKAYLALPSHQSGWLTYRTTTQVMGDTEYKFIRFDTAPVPSNDESSTISPGGAP